MILYQCQDSLEGVFTAIYNAYEDRCLPQDVRVAVEEEYWLFAEPRPVRSNVWKAGKVAGSLRKRFGEEDYRRLCLCLASPDAEKAQAVYRTVARGIGRRTRPGHLFDALADADVQKAHALAQAAWRELHHYYGFVRFRELEQGILYGRIAPKNHLLPFLMPHFAERFPGEDFLLRDEGRGLFGVHPARKQWYLLEADLPVPEEGLALSKQEEQIQELFRHFCRTIAIRDRENPALQKQLLPLRFREHMTEF